MAGPASSFVADFALASAVGGATGLVARRLGQPTILGYLAAGLIIGPSIPVPLFADPQRIDALAEFGVILVMFAIGLEFRISRLLAVLPVSGFTAAIQMGTLGWAGFALGRGFGWTTIEASFLGAALAISSTMVVSRVFANTTVDAEVKAHVFGVLILQDVVAIVLIAVMTGVAAGSGLNASQVGSTLWSLALVMGLLLGGGMLTIPRIMRASVPTASPEVRAVGAVGLCFAFAQIAATLGFSVALGGFVAGLLVAEAGFGSEVEHVIQPLRDVFAAVFFVSIGMSVDPLEAFAYIGPALGVAAVVILGQFGSVALAGVLSGLGLRRALVSGLALGQIGEFGFILVAIGSAGGVIPAALPPIVVTVAALTALTTGLSMKRADALVHFVDVRVPTSVRRGLELYAAWFERLRAPRSRTPERERLRRALAAVVVDGVALLVLLEVGVSGLTARAVPWLRSLGFERGASEVALWAVLALAGLPFAVGLVRNTLAAAEVAPRIIVSDALRQRGVGAPVDRTLRVMVPVLVLLGLGLPVTAILQPLTGTGATAVAVALLLGGAGVFVIRSAGAVGPELTSSTEWVARAMAPPKGREPVVTPKPEVEPPVLPGLDHVVPVAIESVDLDGLTLAELDLRARTGATVVAIQRGESREVLPSGSARLTTGDRVALTGTPQAIERARRTLGAAATPEAPNDDAE